MVNKDPSVWCRCFSFVVEITFSSTVVQGIQPAGKWRNYSFRQTCQEKALQVSKSYFLLQWSSKNGLRASGMFTPSCSAVVPFVYILLTGYLFVA